LLVCAAALTGCASTQSASIQSDAVRELLSRESAKMKEASAASKAFVDQTRGRVENYRKAVADLNRSMLELHRQETVLALALAASQPVEKKTGIEARAFAYRAGLAYLDTQAGIDKAVADQFEEDFAALTKLSASISASWSSLQTLQSELDQYAKRSVLAGADPALLNAVLQQTSTATAEVDRVIERGKKVNKALETLSGFGVFQGEATDRTRAYLLDLLQLLQSAKP